MNATAYTTTHQTTCTATAQAEPSATPTFSLETILLEQIKQQVGRVSASARRVVNRISQEVERVCSKSDRIQNSGDIRSHRLFLGQHRLKKCLAYHKLGSKQGRVELHGNLSVVVYRHIAPTQAQLGFSGRFNLIEDFLQDFYVEALKAFRRENDVPEDYQPRTQFELAEYMAFTEQYAKRRITLPNGYSQQLIVLRAQTFARRMPKETAVDMETAVEFPKGEDAERQHRSATVQQVRAQMVTETPDLWETVKRDRVINALFEYLQNQGHHDCADYLALKLQDLPASEIDTVLDLTPRQRDYLQQRFKYHVEKFARTTHWELVHQWLDADLDQRLGMTQSQWQQFVGQLTEEQAQLLAHKQSQRTDAEIMQLMGLTAKKVQKRWTNVLVLAAKVRNDEG
ncbi:MAG: HetZ-related protein [Spirulina sp. SIO3F2]|nr:HetZ-related protein [Spirulina sp. SIO3F2]